MVTTTKTGETSMSVAWSSYNCYSGWDNSGGGGRSCGGIEGVIIRECYMISNLMATGSPVSKGAKRGK